MKNHRNTARKAPLLQSVRSWFQPSTRRYQRSEGTAFESSMQTRSAEEAYYTYTPMPRV